MYVVFNTARNIVVGCWQKFEWTYKSFVFEFTHKRWGRGVWGKKTFEEKILCIFKIFINNCFVFLNLLCGKIVWKLWIRRRKKEHWEKGCMKGSSNQFLSVRSYFKITETLPVWATECNFTNYLLFNALICFFFSKNSKWRQLWLRKFTLMFKKCGNNFTKWQKNANGNNGVWITVFNCLFLFFCRSSRMKTMKKMMVRLIKKPIIPMTNITKFTICIHSVVIKLHSYSSSWAWKKRNVITFLKNNVQEELKTIPHIFMKISFNGSNYLLYRNLSEINIRN